MLILSLNGISGVRSRHFGSGLSSPQAANIEIGATVTQEVMYLKQPN
ncbi:hypothetical protein ABNM62_03305 [Pseudomonas syringae]